MSLDHIIPKFILKGYTINPTAPPREREIMILNRATNEIVVQKINFAYAIQDFNSEKTERLLCEEYENKVAQIFQRIMKRASDNENFIDLSDAEYKLIFRFFVIMWRRNDIHVQTLENLMEKFMRSFLGNPAQERLREEYRGKDVKELVKNQIMNNLKNFYDHLISITDDNDVTVMKTITNYKLQIIYNTSKINFTLHNTYGTAIYCPSDGEAPIQFIEPISKNLCFSLIRSDCQILSKDKKYKIPIERIDDENRIKENFIYGYITRQATSFVVDDTNEEIVKAKISAEK